MVFNNHVLYWVLQIYTYLSAITQPHHPKIATATNTIAPPPQHHHHHRQHRSIATTAAPHHKTVAFSSVNT
ncbi:hypothetical protein Hanom_Chr03g00196341 [Helianthus anomalus]